MYGMIFGINVVLASAFIMSVYMLGAVAFGSIIALDHYTKGKVHPPIWLVATGFIMYSPIIATLQAPYLIRRLIGSRDNAEKGRNPSGN